MTEDFKKRAQELALKARPAASSNVDARTDADRERLRSDFLSTMEQVLQPIEGSLNEAFGPNGQLFEHMTSRQAIGVQDSRSTFAQLFFYFNRELRERLGRNTASIRFELDADSGKVKVMENTERRPAPLRTVKELAPSELTPEAIESWVGRFVEGATASSSAA